MDELRGRYESWRELRVDERRRRGLGLDAVDPAEIDERFADVTSGDALEALRRDEQEARFDSARENAARLRQLLEDACATARMRASEAELAEFVAGRRVRVGKRACTLAEAEALAAATADADDRAELGRALDAAWRDGFELRGEVQARRAAVWSVLGHATLAARASDRTPQVDVAASIAAADTLLAETESTWHDALGALQTRLGTGARAWLRVDAARAARLDGFARVFPSERVGGVLDWTLEGLGLSVGALPGVQVDASRAAGRHDGAACFALRVPGDVRVVATPRGGWADYAVAFDAVGRAAALAYTSEALPIERRLPGDPALAVAWGLLWRDRLVDPAWARNGPPAQRAEEYLTHARRERLARLRAWAARVGPEAERAALPADAADAARAAVDERLAEALERASGVRQDPELARAFAPALPEARDALRGASLAAALAEFLRAEFGREFWRSKGAGDLFRELWHTGHTYNADSLAAELGIGPLAVDRLLEFLDEAG